MAGSQQHNNDAGYYSQGQYQQQGQDQYYRGQFYQGQFYQGHSTSPQYDDTYPETGSYNGNPHYNQYYSQSTYARPGHMDVSGHRCDQRQMDRYFEDTPQPYLTGQSKDDRRHIMQENINNFDGAFGGDQNGSKEKEEEKEKSSRKHKHKSKSHGGSRR